MANGSGELGEEVGIHQTPDNAYMDSLSSSKCSREWSDPGISNIYSEGRRRNHQSMVIKATKQSAIKARRHGNAYVIVESCNRLSQSHGSTSPFALIIQPHAVEYQGYRNSNTPQATASSKHDRLAC